MRRPVVLLIVMSLILALPTTVRAGAPAQGGAACADIEQPVLMFKIEAKWKKPSYRIGDVAAMPVTVTQTAEEDPVTGQPWPNGRPTSDPAEGVSVAVAMFIGDVYLTGGALTDAQGKAIVKVKIEKYARPGKATTRVYGERIRLKDFPSSACRVVVREYGNVDPGPSLTVTK